MSFKIKAVEGEDNTDHIAAIKPIAEIYDIEEFRKIFDEKIYDKEVPEFGPKDPFVYNLIRVLIEPMILYNKEEELEIILIWHSLLLGVKMISIISNYLLQNLDRILQ